MHFFFQSLIKHVYTVYMKWIKLVKFLKLIKLFEQFEDGMETLLGSQSIQE